MFLSLNFKTYLSTYSLSAVLFGWNITYTQYIFHIYVILLAVGKKQFIFQLER